MGGDGWERFRQLSTKVRVKNVAVEATEKELRQSVHLAGNSAIAEVLVLCIVWVYDYLIYKLQELHEDVTLASVRIKSIVRFTILRNINGPQLSCSVCLTVTSCFVMFW